MTNRMVNLILVVVIAILGIAACGSDKEELAGCTVQNSLRLEHTKKGETDETVATILERDYDLWVGRYDIHGQLRRR